jgi:hypothetical protein
MVKDRDSVATRRTISEAWTYERKLKQEAENSKWNNKIFSSRNFGGPNNSEIPAMPKRAFEEYLHKKNSSKIRAGC